MLAPGLTQRTPYKGAHTTSCCCAAGSHPTQTSGAAAGWGESGDGTKNGITTNMHITSSLLDGPVPKELCIIPTLREHDFGGQINRGHLTGTWPVPSCAAADRAALSAA